MYALTCAMKCHTIVFSGTIDTTVGAGCHDSAKKDLTFGGTRAIFDVYG